MVRFRHCVLPWVFLTCLNAQIHSSSAFLSYGLAFNKYRDFQHAVEKMEDCLGNLNIPIGSPCDDDKLKMSEQEIREKHGIRHGRHITRSKEMSLEERKELASLRCFRYSKCHKEKCVCELGSKCDKVQDHGVTCEVEYENFIRKYDSAKLSGIKMGNEESSESEVHSRKNRNAPGAANYYKLEHRQGQTPEEIEQARIERDRKRDEANDALTKCLSNFNIPYEGDCNQANIDEYRNEISTSAQNGISLDLHTKFAKAECQKTPQNSHCSGSKCVGCSGDCTPKPVAQDSFTCKTVYDVAETLNRLTRERAKARVELFGSCVLNFMNPRDGQCNRDKIEDANRNYSRILRANGNNEAKITLDELKNRYQHRCYPPADCVITACKCDRSNFAACGDGKMPDPTKTCKEEHESFVTAADKEEKGHDGDGDGNGTGGGKGTGCHLHLHKWNSRPTFIGLSLAVTAASGAIF